MEDCSKQSISKKINSLKEEFNKNADIIRNNENSSLVTRNEQIAREIIVLEVQIAKM